MIIRARAPLRISFAGGGTDLSPYVDEHGGVVLNATIDRYAYATLRFHDHPLIRVNSLDYQTVADYGVGEPLVYDGKFDLIKACLRRLGPSVAHQERGIELYLDTEAPPGSGLGASSALVVAVIGALRAWRRLPLEKYEIARVAWEVERKDVGVPGGLQDQYAAVFGGFNLIEFHSQTKVIVNPLRIEPRIVNELQYNLLLVFTGTTRTSSGVIDAQVSNLKEQRPVVVEAMNRMKTLTLEAKDALLTGRLDDLGHILHEEFLEKRRTAEAVATPRIEEMYEEARRLGVVGGKVSGAGGGGFMFLYCPFDRKPAVSARIRAMGGEVVPMAFEPDGVQAWTAQDQPATFSPEVRSLDRASSLTA
jgi:D-glycero-alpha-D-manno-heptose-7-phosphate kinase